MSAKPPYLKWMRTPAGISATLALGFLIGVGAWWATSDDDSIAIPSKVCHERIPGDSIKDLLPKKGKKFSEKSYQLDVVRGYGDCQITAGGERVGFEYIYIPGNEYPRSQAEKHGIPVSLGDSYGYLTGEHGIRLYVPCANRKPSDRLIVSGGASTVTPEGSDKDEWAKPIKADAKIAAYVAEVARSLARDWLHCPRADKLPPGPAHIHWP